MSSKKWLPVLVFALWIAGASSAVSRPNIVLMMADDLGWTDTSVPQTTLGRQSSFIQTPTLARLASEGMSFPQAYVLQNCQPTRAALLTGQYAPSHRNGTYNVTSLDRANDSTPGWPNLPIDPHTQAAQIDPAGVTVHEVLKSAGYRTAWFGKYHAVQNRNSLPVDFGVDVNFASEKVTTGKVGGVTKNSNYLALNDDTAGWKFDIPELSPYAQPYDSNYVQSVLLSLTNGNNPWLAVGTTKHYTDALTDAAVNFVRTQAQSNAPFFLYVPFHSVHTGIVPRPDLNAKYAARPKTDPRHTNVGYAALVEQMDQSVKRILDAIKDPNGDGNFSDSMDTNTLVVFLSDNGGPTGITDNTPLRDGKGTYFEGGIRSPLICRWPGVIPPGMISTQAVHCVDLYPTFAEFASAPLPSPATHLLDGESLAPVLRGQAARLNRESLFWHFPGYMDGRQRPQSLINKRVGDEYYKLFFAYETGQYELYNITRDLSEATNLLAGVPSAQVMQIASGMNTDLRNWLVRKQAPCGSWTANGEPVAFPPADMQLHRIPVVATNQNEILSTITISAGPSSNPLYPGAGKSTFRLSRSQVFSNATHSFIPPGVTVTVQYGVDITAGPTGTISQDSANINYGIGVSHGAGETLLPVDSDNGAALPEWLKIGNIRVDSVVVNPPGQLPAAVGQLIVADFIPARTSSDDVRVILSDDAQVATDEDNLELAFADGSLSKDYDHNINRAEEFHFIVTQGTFWLKALELSLQIRFGDPPPPVTPPLRIEEWSPVEAASVTGGGFLTWYSSMNKTYAIQTSSNLVNFVTLPGASAIPAQPGFFTTVLDLNLTGSPQRYLRVLQKP